MIAASSVPARPIRERTTSSTSKCVYCHELTYDVTTCTKCGQLCHAKCRSNGQCRKCVEERQHDRPIPEAPSNKGHVATGTCVKCTQQTSDYCGECKTWYHRKCGLDLGLCPPCTAKLLVVPPAPVSAAVLRPAPVSAAVPRPVPGSAAVPRPVTDPNHYCYECLTESSTHCTNCKRYIHHTCGFDGSLCYECHNEKKPLSFAERRPTTKFNLFQLRQAISFIATTIHNEKIKMLWPGSLRSREIFRRACDRLLIRDDQTVFVLVHLTDPDHFASFTFTGRNPRLLWYRDSGNNDHPSFKDFAASWPKYFDIEPQVRTHKGTKASTLPEAERANSCGWCVLNDFTNLMRNDVFLERTAFTQQLLQQPEALRLTLSTAKAKGHGAQNRAFIRPPDQRIQRGPPEPLHPGR